MQNLQSSTKVWLFLIGLSLILMMLGYHFAGRLGLFLGFLFALGFQALLHFFGNSRLIEFFQARLLEGQDPWGLQTQIQRHATLMQMPKPYLYLAESSSPFAFSLTQNNGKGSICISTGLLKKLSKPEVEAVIAHQLCHIHGLSRFGFSIAHEMAFAMVGLGRILDQLWMTSKYTRKDQQPFSRLFSPLAWLILRFAISTKVYYKNDEMAAALLKDPKHLADALWKLESYCQTHPLQLPPCSSHFFIVNPLKKVGKKSWMLAHPKIDIRIKKLVGYFPI